MFILIWIST